MESGPVHPQKKQQCLQYFLFFCTYTTTSHTFLLTFGAEKINKKKPPPEPSFQVQQSSNLFLSPFRLQSIRRKNQMREKHGRFPIFSRVFLLPMRKYTFPISAVNSTVSIYCRIFNSYQNLNGGNNIAKTIIFLKLRDFVAHSRFHWFFLSK